MSEHEEIEGECILMVRCPYCSEEWCRDSDELVCSECEPALRIDLAVAEMVKATEELAGHLPAKVEARIDLLQSIHTNLTNIIKKARPRKEKK